MKMMATTRSIKEPLIDLYAFATEPVAFRARHGRPPCTRCTQGRP
jgi:hypothetical protein